MFRSPRLLAGLATFVVVTGLAGFASGWFVPTETTVTEIAPGVWFRKTETQPKFIGCNQGWIIFRDFVLVIDANFPNQAEILIREVRKTTDKPIRYVFDTHHHGDHANGNQKFVEIGATAVASENSRPLYDSRAKPQFEKLRTEQPEEYAKLEFSPPTLLFPKKLVMDDGTQRVELIHYGHAHTAGDAIAWLPRHGIAFTGDACVNGAFNYTGESDTASWIGVLTEVAELPIKQVCPGHGEPSDKSLLATQKRYFVELREAVRTAIDGGKSLDEIKRTLDLPWYEQWAGVAAKTRTENIEHVYGELTAKKAAKP